MTASEPSVSEPLESTDTHHTGDSDVQVHIDDVTKIFQEDSGSEVVAVEDLSLEINDGEFLVFVGPSGCGKTTSLRIIAGLEETTSGRIEIGGFDVTGLDPRERDVSMVFQNYALYPHKTVRENLAFPLNIRKYPGEEIESRVDETAELLQITEMLDRKPEALSGGQQQRVALGRAIIREPEVFLMDEPLSNLDAKLRVRMRTELNELHNRLEKTVIYVTHDQAEAMTLGDRIAVMNDGELQQLGSPQTLYDEPVNKFVAGFIGEPPMNFMPVTYRDGVLETPYFDIQAPAEVVNCLPEQGDNAWTFGIRPEDVYDTATSQEVTGVEYQFEAEVKVVEPMGSDKFLTLLPTDGDDPELSARVSPESEAAVGDVLQMVLDPAKIHVFAADGENLTRSID